MLDGLDCNLFVSTRICIWDEIRKAGFTYGKLLHEFARTPEAHS